jgi:hypothetical protein
VGLEEERKGLPRRNKSTKERGGRGYLDNMIVEGPLDKSNEDLGINQSN